MSSPRKRGSAEQKRSKRLWTSFFFWGSPCVSPTQDGFFIFIMTAPASFAFLVGEIFTKIGMALGTFSFIGFGKIRMVSFLKVCGVGNFGVALSTRNKFLRVSDMKGTF